MRIDGHFLHYSSQSHNHCRSWRAGKFCSFCACYQRRLKTKYCVHRRGVIPATARRLNILYFSEESKILSLGPWLSLARYSSVSSCSSCDAFTFSLSRRSGARYALFLSHQTGPNHRKKDVGKLLAKAMWRKSRCSAPTRRQRC